MSTLLSQIAGSSRGIPAEILMLGGGGGGGGYGANGYSGGGGGAGELFQASFVYIIPSYTYVIGVGTSGIGGTQITTSGSNGGDSTFAIQGVTSGREILRARGGGGGGTQKSTTTAAVPGQDGGCGGGNSGGQLATTSGTTTSSNQSLFDVSLLGFSQRFVGFSGASASTTASRSGGGIGGSPTSNAVGGPGLSFSITGSSLTYGEGGDCPTSGGIINAAANTGNGGQNNSGASGGGGNGGSGVVIIAYPDIYSVPTSITGTYDQPTRSGWRVYRFTAGISTVTW